MENNDEPKKKRGRPRKYPLPSTSIKPRKKTKSKGKPTRVKPKISNINEILLISNNELKLHLRKLTDDIIFASIQDRDEVVKDKILSNVTKKQLKIYEDTADNLLYNKFTEEEVNDATELLINPFKRIKNKNDKGI